MRISRRIIAIFVSSLLFGALMVSGAGSASAVTCVNAFSDAQRRSLGFEGLCGEPLVFSDAKTGDLWLTDDTGAGPFRLTHTPMVEENPAGLFPWVFYDGTTKDGSDIYMLSLIDPGAGRVRITGLKTQDWDPTAVSMYIPGQADSRPQVGNRPMAKGPGGFFYPILLGYSSDRDANKHRCGIELFVEVFSLTGPERASQCDKTDKLDAEFSLGGDPQLAYEGWPWNGSQPGVYNLTDGPDPAVRLADGQFPTWNDFCCPESGPTPSQPAGEESVSFTAPDGTISAVWTDGSSEDAYLYPPTGNNVTFGESEYSSGFPIMFGVIEQNATKSWVANVVSGPTCDNSACPPITDKKKFWVQSFDWVAYPSSP